MGMSCQNQTQPHLIIVSEKTILKLRKDVLVVIRMVVSVIVKLQIVSTSMNVKLMAALGLILVKPLAMFTPGHLSIVENMTKIVLIHLF